MNKEIIQKSKILIIDDQPQNVLLLQRMLMQAGYENIKGITDSRQVFAVFSEFQPDLVALDLRMPNIDGFEFLRSVKLWVPEGTYVPILVLTADSSSKAKQDALALGAKDFLVKPLNMTEVLLRIYNLLETRWLHVRLAQYNETLESRIRERTQELQDAQREILDRLAIASDFRDDDTGQHTQRVGTLAAVLARAAGLPEEQVHLIRLAAPLHDVGKIGVPDGILLKSSSLTPEEMDRIKKHTVIGGTILSGSRFAILQMAERIARYHHERWDGRGYHGLMGEEIPLEARIVTIADSFDVIVHARPYKPAGTAAQAYAVIRQERGKQFDPQLADVFCQIAADRSLIKLQEALDLEMPSAVLVVNSVGSADASSTHLPTAASPRTA